MHMYGVGVPKVQKGALASTGRSFSVVKLRGIIVSRGLVRGVRVSVAVKGGGYGAGDRSDDKINYSDLKTT